MKRDQILRTFPRKITEGKQERGKNKKHILRCTKGGRPPALWG